ncbi:MAG: hypothetical protein IJ019_04390 [Alphaproteobacteria bacterium]|nr:hypothetical protein [Alphaproteobacteria bacterium]
MIKTSGTGTSATTTIQNPFGGNVTIDGSPLKSGDTDGAFRITYEGLSKEACVTLATGDWGSGQSSVLIAMVAAEDASTAHTTADAAYVTTTDGTAAASDGAASVAVPSGTNVKTSMPIANAVKSCSETTNAVVWKYY